MLSLHQFKLLVLILGSVSLMLSSCDETTPTDPNEPFRVSKEACLNGAKDKVVKMVCCNFVKEDDTALGKCTEEKMFYDIADNKHDQILYFSKFVVCIYEKRKLIKSDTQLDMEKVKDDAKLQYPDQSKARHFIIDMYKDCSRKAAKQLNHTNSSPNRKALLYDVEKPFLMFVYRCVEKYSETKCPPYIWDGPAVALSNLCHKWAEDCEVLMAKKSET